MSQVLAATGFTVIVLILSSHNYDLFSYPKGIWYRQVNSLQDKGPIFILS